LQTIEEIWQIVTGKAKTERKEALRKYVVALNRLAALEIIENGLLCVVSLYREDST